MGVRWLFSPAVGYLLQGITALFRFRDVNLQDPSQCPLVVFPSSRLLAAAVTSKESLFCSASGMLTFMTLHSEVPLVVFPRSRLLAAAVTSKESLFCSASGMLAFRTLHSEVPLVAFPRSRLLAAV